MKEITGNIFDIKDADAICCTTNGVVKANGELVMGAGIAKQFAERWPQLPKLFGKIVLKYGNVVQQTLPDDIGEGFTVIAFPTKDHWREPSDLWLIKQSAITLKKWADEFEEQMDRKPKVVLPRPGTGLGRLPWEQVKAVLEPILDDRFYIITPK